MTTQPEHTSGKTSDFAKAIADKLIEQLEAGTSPFQRPWKTLVGTQEINAVTGKPYRGANAFWLSLQGREDPRWMTFNQAKAAGYHVNKGEKGVPLTKYVFERDIPMVDAEGKKVLDSDGKQKMEKVRLDKPIVVNFYVFNAEQISGVEPYKTPDFTSNWNVNERAEAILQASQANIYHKMLDKAFYRPSTDEIILPPRAAFDSPSDYYATALHELGHWTGHESRLNRELVGFQTDKTAYAREELRAEIASLMLTKTLGLPHDFDNHASYVDSWVQLLKDHPNEILFAARDAEKIHDFVMQFDRHREHEEPQKNQELTM